ncbi:hypothetical protein SLA2020_107320 [Shorea laevis]
METLVVVEQHRNQYHSRVRSNGSGRFGSSPSRNFRQINCRTFQSDAGVLPSPFKQSSSPVDSRSSVKSSSIPISNHRNPKKKSFNGFAGEGLLYSELWAGPAYSNSPPPNSLPMPKFSLREKRAVSLDLPASDTVSTVHPTAKSAPTSPTRVHNPSATELFVTVDSATRTLRRILNLDSADD